MSATTTLLDLINANLLQVGNKVLVRDVEGELTPQGTIISTTERGTIEYKTPTGFSKAVTNSTSGGWQQVKLKSSGGRTSLLDVKRKYAGYISKKRYRSSSGGQASEPPPRARVHVPTSTSSSPAIISYQHADEESAVKAALAAMTLPVLIRFRDDDTKRGKINRVGDDTKFELEYKGAMYHSVAAAARAMNRDFAEETGESASTTSSLDDVKYQNSAGEWCKLRDLIPNTISKKYVNIQQPISYTPTASGGGPTTPRRDSNAHMVDDQTDEENEDEMNEVMSDDESDPVTPPPLSPPSPTSAPPPPRSTMIAKHVKHAHPSIASSSEISIKPPMSPTSYNGKASTQPIVLSLKSPAQTTTTHAKRGPNKEIELLVHVESTDSIPYEVVGLADSYDALRSRIAQTIPAFPFNEAHEIGVYSEYWEKHAGVAYVKPPRNWADFPGCTTVLLKKIPETIIINTLDI